MRRELAELKLVVDKEKGGKGNAVGRKRVYRRFYQGGDGSC